MVDLACSMGFYVVGNGGSDLQDGIKLMLCGCVHYIQRVWCSMAKCIEGKSLVIGWMSRVAGGKKLCTY